MIINVLDYLEDSVKRFSNKIAFADDQNKITYHELFAQSKAIGSCIFSSCGKTKKPVLVIIDRDISSLVSFIGVVYSGNFYVPIERQMPQKRMAHIIQTLQPQAAVIHSRDAGMIKDAGFAGKTIFYEDALSYAINENALERIRKKAVDTDPLYAVFTSGSTGVPKGVLVNHRSVIDLVEHFTSLFGFSEKSVIGNQAPFDFDVSVKDIYLTLKNGGTMYIVPKMLFSFPAKLIEYLNKKRINTAIWATSALRIVANLKGLEKEKPRYLKTILFSGEVMPNKVLNYWRRHIPDASYVNLYGPTEITCNCTYFIVDRAFSDNDILPIGIPFPNTDVMVLDAHDRQVTEGEMGEICVRGTSLAMGYYNNPQKTSEAFCQNPLNLHYPELIYRTGDLGKYNDRGELLFLSRKDNQIKAYGAPYRTGRDRVGGQCAEHDRCGLLPL